MNLIKWKDNKIEITPEAYAIKAFRNIWNSDKSKSKERAVLILSILYFMYDPRSEYQFEIDENDRLNTIKEQIGIEKKWMPDKNFKDAIPVYKYLTNTTSSKMLESTRKIIESTRKNLEALDLSEVSIDKRAGAASGILSALKASTSLMIDVAIAEKKVFAEVEENNTKMRGSGTKTIGDEGLNNLFN